MTSHEKWDFALLARMLREAYREVDGDIRCLPRSIEPRAVAHGEAIPPTPSTSSRAAASDANDPSEPS